jgi:hypothetical protein
VYQRLWQYLCNPKTYFAFMVVFFVALIVTLVSLGLTACTDPGILPRHKQQPAVCVFQALCIRFLFAPFPNCRLVKVGIFQIKHQLSDLRGLSTAVIAIASLKVCILPYCLMAPL